jgi:hypothetical protein
MALVIARLSLPKISSNGISTCMRAARFGLLTGTAGLFGAHIYAKTSLVQTQCQGMQLCASFLQRL